ncbi:MAG: energy-coupling factor ABC transporter ATP-binding protein [Spirochaetaceae bacterium]|nr:energy-coupling factor ABC transporter ATP-binding protein [Spirochaetaceae bacterium]
MHEIPLYSAEGLMLRYGPIETGWSLRIPMLELAENESVMILGPNGSGKTTFLKLLDDLPFEDSGGAEFSGELRFRGEVVRKDGNCMHPRSLREKAVYLHQHPCILAGSVAGNLSFACRARKLPRDTWGMATGKALKLVGLQGYESRNGKSLSGGESQRLALARALIADPPVLLLDEPTASADESSRERIMEILCERAKSGRTVIFSTHDRKLMRRLAGRVIEFRNGAIVGDSRSCE